MIRLFKSTWLPDSQNQVLLTAHRANFASFDPGHLSNPESIGGMADY